MPTRRDNTKRALLTLHSQFKVALDASRKDDKLDENNDGVADVKQIDSKTVSRGQVSTGGRHVHNAAAVWGALWGRRGAAPHVHLVPPAPRPCSW